MPSSIASTHPFAIAENLRLPLPRPALHLTERIAGRLLALDRCRTIYDGIPADLAGPDFLVSLVQQLGVSLEADAGEMRRIPAAGATIVVANHPFGALEGILLAEMLLRIRPDVKILANHLLGRFPQLRDLLIMVDPFGGTGAVRRNLRPVREAIRWLQGGGLLVVFPAGEVSHLRLSARAIADPPWNDNLAGLVRHSGAAVLPVFFPGANSPLFQLAGLLHPRLRTALLPREFLNKRQRRIPVRIGSLIANRKLAAMGEDAGLVAYLRLRTYLLAGRSRSPGDKVTTAPDTGRLEPLTAAQPPERLLAEVESLPAAQVLAESGPLVALEADARQIPYLLLEIGRLRELTFRQVGEGTGREIDLDHFDAHYTHLFLWNREKREVVGAYRLGRTDEIRVRFGVAGLYSHTLFAYSEELLDRLGPALELGRSFVRPEYQRQFSPLLLLWKGIGAFVRRHPRYRMLFGPVSISRDYSRLSRRLMADALQERCEIPELARLVRARNPLRRRRLGVKGCDPTLASALCRDFDEVAEVVADLDPGPGGIPVLLRHYLNLGGQMLAFNVDRQFSDVLDGLVVVDLARTERKALERYLGRDGAADFLRHHADAPPGAFDACA
ncbi:MAG TPA: lysophospholipid acyltransferase family protein [Desulfuromonadales bacterium]